MIRIDEVIGRAVQGVTRPFICRGSDGHVYYVKGAGAGRRSQICEWIAGNLALTLCLPIAPFTLVEIPEELDAVSDMPDWRDLGTGMAFGSRRMTIAELT